MSLKSAFHAIELFAILQFKDYLGACDHFMCNFSTIDESVMWIIIIFKSIIKWIAEIFSCKEGFLVLSKNWKHNTTYENNFKIEIKIDRIKWNLISPYL